MDKKSRKQHEKAAVIMKHASVIKTLALATAGFKNGTIKVISPPRSNTDIKATINN